MHKLFIIPNQSPSHPSPYPQSLISVSPRPPVFLMHAVRTPSSKDTPSPLAPQCLPTRTPSYGLLKPGRIPRCSDQKGFWMLRASFYIGTTLYLSELVSSVSNRSSIDSGNGGGGSSSSSSSSSTSTCSSILKLCATISISKVQHIFFQANAANLIIHTLWV